MALAKKLLSVMTECAHIGKDGYNNFSKYPYVTAAKVNDVVNSALVNVGIATTSKAEIIELREVATKEGKAERLATVKVAITLHDTDSEETLEISGVGCGQDVGDKGIAKAQTMAVKYAWKSCLLIADASDDPDSDGVGEIVQTSAPGGANKQAPTSNGWNGDGKKIVGKCEKCGKDVNEKSAAYSKKYHGGKILCYDCQQKLRANKTAESAPF